MIFFRFLECKKFKNIPIPHVQTEKKQGRGWRWRALSMFESKSAGSLLVDNPFLCRVAALYLSSQGGKMVRISAEV